MQKNEKDSKSQLYTVLIALNIIGIAFPLGYYVQTDGGTQIFAAVILVCAGLLCLLLDGVAALLANFDVNQL